MDDLIAERIAQAPDPDDNVIATAHGSHSAGSRRARMRARDDGSAKRANIASLPPSFTHGSMPARVNPLTVKATSSDSSIATGTLNGIGRMYGPIIPDTKLSGRNDTITANDGDDTISGGVGADVQNHVVGGHRIGIEALRAEIAALLVT